MAAKRTTKTAKPKRVFGQRHNPAEMFRAGLYARVSTQDQKTLPPQIRAIREYAAKRGWEIAVQVKEVGSGAAERELREKLMAAARRREIDVVLVWRLDRWGRSLADLVVTLKELAELGVGFVSLTEALDLTTPTGRAMAGLLSVFAEFEHEILRERIRAGIVEARRKGTKLGRPLTAAKKAPQIQSFIVQASAKPGLPAASASAAPPCVESWLTYSWQKYVRHHVQNGREGPLHASSRSATRSTAANSHPTDQAASTSLPKQRPDRRAARLRRTQRRHQVADLSGRRFRHRPASQLAMDGGRPDL